MASVDVGDPGEMEDESTSREVIDDDSDMEVLFDSGEGIQFPGHDYNVMLDPVILTHLFDLHTISELSHLRLVCKRWFELLLPRWRREMTLVVHKLDPPGREESALKRLKWDNISQLWEADGDEGNDILKLSSKPYNSFHLMQAQFTRNSLESNRFWKMCGSSIRHVELELVDVHSVTSFVNTILEGMPALVSLSLRRVHCSNERGWSSDSELGGRSLNKNLKCLKLLEGCRSRIESQWPWLTFLEHFPNLENLELDGLSESRVLSGLVEALVELGENKEQTRVMRISSLNICEQFLDNQKRIIARIHNPADLKRLLERKEIKLTSLHLGMALVEDRFGDVLRHAIQSHGDTLEKLHVHNSADSSRKPYTHFPWGIALHSLAELHLKGARPVMGNLHFLQHTPNLRILHICQPNLDRILSLRKAPPLQTPALAHLLELWIEGSGKDVLAPGQVERLAHLMPNLKRLKCSLTADAVRVVCEKWRGLRMLETWSDKLKDSAVTGLGRGLHGNEESCPNLTDLKDLRELSLGKVNNLTDLSVYTGFLKMDQLRVLKVTVSRKISVAAFKALTRRFPGAEVKREESGNFFGVKEIGPDNMMVRRMMEFGPMPVGRVGGQLEEEEYIEVRIIPA